MAKVTVHEAELMAHDDIESLKREYAHMRDIARKRMNRIHNDEFDWTKASKERFPAYSQMENKGDLPKAFSDLSKFLSAKRSTLGGQRQIRESTSITLNKAIGAYEVDEKTQKYLLDDKGHYILKKDVASVNNENYERVIAILNEARRQKITYGSDKIVELADATLGVSQKTFNKILDNLDSMLLNSHRLSQIPELDGYSFEQIQKAIK